jgi:hypothetical protein
MPRPIDPEFLKIQIAGLRIALPEIDEDEILRLDMISGETDLDQVVSSLLDVRQESVEIRDGIDQRMAQLRIRYERAELRMERIGEALRQIMQAADLQKLVTPEATLSIGKGRSRIEITDLNAIPQGYAKTVKTPDKAAILAAIKAGTEIPGAISVQGEPVLNIRTK